MVDAVSVAAKIAEMKPTDVLLKMLGFSRASNVSICSRSAPLWRWDIKP
jgi:hypothetical protein